MTDLKHYNTLGVAQDSTSEEIKAAYRRLCKEHHPDRNDNSAESVLKTQEINAAYEVLSDEKKREYYDVYGDMTEQERSISEAVSAMVLQAFMESNPNPIHSVRSEQQRNIDELEIRIKRCCATIKRITKARHRMTKHPKSWLSVTNAARREIHNNWRQAKQSIVYAKLVINMLKQYELEQEEDNRPPTLDDYMRQGFLGNNRGAFR